MRLKADARIDATLDTTRMLSHWLYVFSVDSPELSADQKKMRAQVEYATLYMERDALKAECEQLKSSAMKHKSGRGGSQSRGHQKKAWWP